MPVLARRLRLLRALGAARPPLIAVVCGVSLLNALIPAATAVATALLVARIGGHGAGGLLGAAVGPLVLVGVAMLAGHAAEAASVPLEYLVKVRIDGAHREELARLASSAPTVDGLERSEVQELIRVARADPQNWTERTPGDGALGQIRWVTGLLGALASCAVLARYAWWLVPLLLVPAALNRYLGNRMQNLFATLWRVGIPEGMRASAWETALTSPGEGKDIRVYGLESWTITKTTAHTVSMMRGAWNLFGKARRGDLRRFLLIAVPLPVAYAAVAAGTAHGHATVAVETAVLASGWSLFQAFGFSEDARNMSAALESLDAFDDAAAELGSARSATSSETKTSTSRGTSHVSTASDAPASDATPPDALAPDVTAPLIRFEDVSFAYPGTTRQVADHLNLEIRPHELLAVVGLNGAGKSTLIKLLSGLYLPTSGRITADGTDIQDLGPEQWRHRIAVVFQDFVRYQLSAAQNVTLGHGNVPIDREALEAAAEDAGLGTVLDRLPEGWDTPLARTRTGGVDLSGGQWQQVVLARALYAVRTGARLLVLDEPTAHLDVRTEFEVFDRLAARRGETSVVLISHRLSTVRQAGRIVLLENGRITESGSHDELIRTGGAYAEMFTIQAERFQHGYDDRAEFAEYEEATHG